VGRAICTFLPDAILYRDCVGFGAIAYSDLRLPKDLLGLSRARQFQQTWTLVA
jgi:hypothetical protein